VNPIRLGIVGVGKIARDQHLPAIRALAPFELVACASRHAGVEGVACHATLGAMLDAHPEIDAVVIATPPQVHFEAARLALQRNKHVFLEKPPCATTAEFDQLVRLARGANLTLFQSWHSRHAAGVEPARRWLEGRAVRAVRIVWKEDIRHWHPGQSWILEAGGFGVFDPGINALSILTAILPGATRVTHARLFVPANCQAPIAADLTLEVDGAVPGSVAFDFRHTGEQRWDIAVDTGCGTLTLALGGAALSIDGVAVATPGHDGEYRALYRRFAELVSQGRSDTDAEPFRLVADAFLIAERESVDAFLL
jgi:D-galactose 1-dehydrogenase